MGLSAGGFQGAVKLIHTWMCGPSSCAAMLLNLSFRTVCDRLTSNRASNDDTRLAAAYFNPLQESIVCNIQQTIQ